MGHTYSRLLVHVIFSTKERRPFIHADIRPRLHEYMAGIARQEFGHAIRIGGVDDHLHGLLALRSDTSIAHAMNRWKSLSSGWINKTFELPGRFAWQAGYGAFSVSPSNERQVCQYIDHQVEHHRTVSFQEEFIAFLKRHRIDYDPETIWR